jgi:hypothetical protein
MLPVVMACIKKVGKLFCCALCDAPMIGRPEKIFNRGSDRGKKISIDPSDPARIFSSDQCCRGPDRPAGEN